VVLRDSVESPCIPKLENDFGLIWECGCDPSFGAKVAFGKPRFELNIFVLKGMAISSAVRLIVTTEDVSALNAGLISTVSVVNWGSHSTTAASNSR
jgi:hypothetical protein